MEHHSVVWDTYVGQYQHACCFAGCGAIIDREYDRGGKSYHAWDRAHVFAKSKNGDGSIANLRPTCITCNRSSQSEHLFTYMKINHRVPPWIDHAFNNHVVNESDIIQPRVLEHRPLRDKLLLIGNPVGMINACTGSGKTSLAIELIGARLSKHIILWITEMNCIIESQFRTENILMWKNAGILPIDTTILFKTHLKHCTRFPSTCIIATTRACALDYYTKICYDERFLGFVVDECHRDPDGNATYNMLSTMIPLAEIRIGLTATPANKDRVNTIFNADYDGNNADECNGVTTLVNYSLFDGLTDGCIRMPKLEFATVDGVGSVRNLKNPTDLISIITNIIDRSATRKGILWCDDIDQTKHVASLIRHALEQSGVAVYVSHSKINNQHASGLFLERDRNCVMVTCEQYRQGADVRHLSFGILCGSQKHDIAVLVQMIGRLTRKEPHDAIFVDLMVSTNSEDYVQNVRNRILNYYEYTCRHVEVKYHCAGGRCTFTFGNIAIEFSVTGDISLQSFDFKFDFEDLMVMLREHGSTIDVDYLRKLFTGLGLFKSHEIEKYLKETNDELLRK